MKGAYSMTRKHFIEVAKILGENTKSNNDNIMLEFLVFLKRQNPNFDKYRFLNYVENIRAKKKG